MQLWRISDFAELSGRGGLLGPARWHSIPRPLIYLADRPASALLEVLAHMEVDGIDLPDSYQLLAVDVPDDVAFDDVPVLNADWRRKFDVTQHIGNRWLEEGRRALLRVPSAIVPHAWNWLLNVTHVAARRARVVEVVRATFDPRLVR